MIKSILVCTDGSTHGDVACEYGIHLARQLVARLACLHVLDSRMLEGPLMADISGWVGAQPYGAQLQQFRELMEQKGQAVLNAFADRCEKAGLTAETRLEMGHPARIILQEEGKAELLIMGQKGEHAEWIGEMMGSNVERVVRHSSNPCLITPGAFTPVSKVLAAYDGSGHASQALHEAAELAAALNTDLVIVTVTDHLDGDRAQQISRDGVILARGHQCRVSGVVAEGKAEAAILRTAQEQGCNLVVVGAYGHSRIREMVLGSTTAHLIAKAEMPVMLVR